jgi:glycine/D-amino acid oxidase-like deaminating enzyme
MLPLIHTDALDFSQPVQSYWEATAHAPGFSLSPLTSDETCDVAIVGAGVTGLNAALELAGNGVDVRIIDAGHIGWGASGRNGGFACFGSHKLSAATLLKRYGKDETAKYYRAMKQAIARVAANLEEHDINAWKSGEGDISLAHAPDRVADLKAEADFITSMTGDVPRLYPREELRQHGIYGHHFYGAMLHSNGFGIHPLNYVQGLARATIKAGIKLYPHSRMIAWEQSSGMHRIRTAKGSLKARKVLVATNGYTPENISTHHHARLLPAMSNIIVTRPLTQDEKQEAGWTSTVMASDTRNLLHYFRLLPNNAFLFGGRGGTNSSSDGEATYRALITQEFHNMFPAWRTVEITHFWRGFVCLAFDKVPFVGALDEAKSVWTSIAYHGSGVAMGSHSGREVARMMLGKPHALPLIMTRRLAKFPLPLLRPLYLKGAYMWFGWKDRK